MPGSYSPFARRAYALPPARGYKPPTPSKGVGGWTPTNLGASLLAWWTADRADLITLSGSQVTSWKDVVAAYDMVQGVGASRPVYGATSFNGAPGVTFDGSDDEMTLASQPFPSGANPSTLWGLAQQSALAADASTRLLLSYGGTTTSTRRSFQRVVVTGTNRARASTGNGVSESVATGATVDYSTRHVLRGKITGTDVSLFVDGGAAASQAVVSNTGTTRARIGANCADTAAGFWNGIVRDILITQTLSDADASALETYLLNRRQL